MARLDRLRVRFAERAAARLFEQVMAGPLDKPGRGAAWWASLVLATVVHLFTIGLVALGVWVLLIGGSIIAIVFGVALFALAFLMRPRLGRLPKDATMVDPAAAPRLYALVGRVTERLGARPVWRIVLTADFNAAFTAVGLRQRKVLLLGLPLWNLLDPRERVALLGHEIGHGVNGDTRRGLYVGSSVGSLAELYVTLRSETHTDWDGGIVAVGVAFSRFVMWVLSWPILGLILIQERFLAQSGQRAEYYADHLAAELAGSAATRAMLDLVRLAGPCMRDLHTAVVRGDPDVLAVNRAWLAGLADADRALMIERVESEPHRVDSTHPPTRMRMAAIERRDYGADVLTASSADADAIDEELHMSHRPILEELRASVIGW